MQNYSPLGMATPTHRDPETNTGHADEAEQSMAINNSILGSDLCLFQGQSVFT